MIIVAIKQLDKNSLNLYSEQGFERQKGWMASRLVLAEAETPRLKQIEARLNQRVVQDRILEGKGNKGHE